MSVKSVGALEELAAISAMKRWPALGWWRDNIARNPPTAVGPPCPPVSSRQYTAAELGLAAEDLAGTVQPATAAWVLVQLAHEAGLEEHQALAAALAYLSEADPSQ